jgi:DNA-binding LacI/PurR family transcriptional regulator
MPVTAKDVARELNLSQPTVSRILNGDQGHRASEETRKRVWETAQRLGYQPNALARSLRRGRTDIIGVHTGPNYDVRNDFLGNIVGALQMACAPRHLDVMLHTALVGDSSQGIFGKLRDGRIDGLILHTSADDPLVAMLRDSSLPVVAVADPLPGLAAVCTDDGLGMRRLLDVLWRKGYRRFVFVAPEFWLASVERRRAAFVDELERRELPTEDAQVLYINFERTAPILEDLLALRSVKKPLAVCCWNDLTAYDLLRTCAQKEVRVPEDFAVTGFDGFRDEKLPARQLVTVGCPWDEVASTALEMLVGMIENRHAEDEQENGKMAPTEILLPPVLLDGDTI